MYARRGLSTINAIHGVRYINSGYWDDTVHPITRSVEAELILFDSTQNHPFSWVTLPPPNCWKAFWSYLE